MAFSLNRLTLYALIGALEEDLRSLLSAHVPVSITPEDAFGEELFAKCMERHQQEHGENSYISNYSELLPYTDFSDIYKLLQTHKSHFGPEWAKQLKLLVPIFEKINPIRNRVAHNRPLNFDDMPVCLGGIDKIKNAVQKKWSSLEEVQSKIANNPGWVLELNLPVPPKDRIDHNLPIPDFDETGFMGRADHLRSVKSMLKGPYPVISIIGEGGLGKTALALKAAYDMLDDEDCNYDAIVWSTAKANTVSALEVKRIENAVTDSLGMLRSVAAELTGDETEDGSKDELLTYLEEFKIMLILDNLETVIDAEIRGFFEMLPAGTKVLTTSRIGLGEFERRLNLTSMTSPEGSSLLRAVSAARGVEILSKSPQKKLNEYSHKLKNNPGFIKWFVSCVQSGIRPEKALHQTGIFLDFCLENVYHYLSNDSRKVLDVMQTIPRILSIPEFSYISDLEPTRLQSAIHQLLQTNMLSMISAGDEHDSETKYGLSELARSYLLKQHPVGETDYKRFKVKQADLAKMHGKISGGFSVDQSSAFKIAVRNRSDTVTASYLLDALKAAKLRNYDAAYSLVDKAKELSPGYYEVHRVEAWVNAQNGNTLAAKNAYEAAYELAQDCPQLLVWYAGFLQRHENDYELALELFDKALKISPDNVYAIIERARLQLHMGHFEKAASDLKTAKASIYRSRSRIARVYWDLSLQLHSRQAEHFVDEKDYPNAISSCEAYFSCLDIMPNELIDTKHVSRLKFISTLLFSVAERLADRELQDQCQSMIDRCKTEIGYLEQKQPHLARSSEAADPKHEGRIRSLMPFFGFIEHSTDEEDIYFNKHEFPVSQAQRLRVGQAVRFNIGKNKEGSCAINCSLIES